MSVLGVSVGAKRNNRRSRISYVLRRMKACWQLYLIISLPVVYMLIFSYYPMYGVQIAFKDFRIVEGIQGSQWVGLKYFIKFIDSAMFGRVFGNTLLITLYYLICGTPLPIILALCLNSVSNVRFRRTVQTIVYMPHFISTVVFVGMMYTMLARETGIVNRLIGVFGGESIDFMGRTDLFRHVYVWSDIWKSVGYNSIVYFAALSGISPELHEAALIDGASKLQRMWHIDLPGIMPTINILFIMSCAGLLSTGFEKILLMQNNLNLSVSETIDTYVYKIGLNSAVPNFSYSTAIGLFKSLIGLVLMITSNTISEKISGNGLW